MWKNHIIRLYVIKMGVKTIPMTIEDLINKRIALKEINDYEEADKIREYLLSKGISLKDINNTTEWDINFNR